MQLMAILLLLVALAVPARAAPFGSDAGLRRSLHAASVELGPGRCSGVLAESTQLILTAHHCIRDADQSVRARLSTGDVRTAWIVATDEASDQAVLFLEEPAPLEPLAVARRRQVPGSVLYFEGIPSRPRFQEARLERIGRCGSLPSLPNALFTTIDGTPGDSGAPLVDAAGRIVGLVHGGAQCHIATPADTLVRLLDKLLERDVVELTGTAGRRPTLS